MTNKGNRRWALGALASTASMAAFPRVGFATTPAQTEGPFYPTQSMRFEDNDNDLVKISGVVREAGGEIVTLRGHVLGRDDTPISNARVEIWQCDVNGRYIHTGERGQGERDPAFQGFGHFVTGDDGTYEFRTIKPVAYPGRTPHIHVKAILPKATLTTQFYIAGHPANMSDGIFRRLSQRQRESVEMVFTEGEGGELAIVDIRLA